MDRLISLCEKKYSPEKVELIKRAADFARTVHDGQKRESGEPYYSHPEAVAISLAKMDMDADTVAAGLLHDVVEDGDGITVEKLAELFDDDIAKMVDGVTKLTKTGHTSDMQTKEDRQAENLRKMYLAMANDVRVIIIKLADRLHNMRTLGNCSLEKRQRIARETLDVYAPLADRFGMGAIKAELEDLSFEYLYPEEWRHLCSLIEPKQDERMRLLNSAMKTITEALEQAGIKNEISGRRKHMYSIFRKLKGKNRSLNEIYDLVALRVIVGTVNDCYAALGVIHSIWKPMPGRFKDYISMPKTNMYRSLHTTLFSDLGMPFEVQIRTLEMHRTAEYGVAAHWLYKEGRARPDELDSKLAWVRDLINYEGDADSTREFIDNIQKDFFSDYVYVLTPNGEIIDLPAGSTPIDFAYRIHSNVGNHIQHAKVNGALVKLDHKLKTHDVVEIITNQQSTPGRDWLNYAKTSHAKTKIRQWFKKANREENIVRGRDMLTEACKRQGKKLSDLLKPEYYNPLLKRFTLNDMDDVYAAIGYGGMTTGQVLHRLMEEYRKEQKLHELEEKQQRREEQKASFDEQGRGVIVKGQHDMVVHFAKCCTPVPGDEIFGYITRGRGVSIHRKDCPNSEALQLDVERIVPVEWVMTESHTFPVTIHVLAEERPGLMLEITQLLLSMKINTKYLNAKSAGATVDVNLTFDIKDSEQLQTLIKNLQKLDSVLEVERSNQL
ncbi:MAG: bifunctional (p)ppGpp synthetase/guanosine-3',5'-bis(diphosphate) 3'-pyrophosphohydrolase [Clostridia bacterium]|nr:bifunctional (p)ppGpp synthetase/guanosine-3',5'-bis(diphosphate) 3'-pyrophosphohydrolase [Clostridia bacterium]MBR6108289.1 bifunctional (p)ppGpp synthetase/guanosine-3',5'-bis(diphosphate) 3'-pyrophosphohydrolase [Clostridia bacterium]